MAAGVMMADEAVAEAEAQAARRHERLLLEDRVQRLNRQMLGPRKDETTGLWSRRHRAGTCGLAHSERVEMGYVVRPEGPDTSELRGVVVCASPNLCLRCSVKISAARADQIQLLAAAMKALGYHAYLITPTFSHSRTDGFAVSYDDMMVGWKALRESRLWRRLTADGGGFVRQVEVTWSQANGFHPHIHALVFSRLDLSDDREFGPSELETAEHALWVEWSAQMGKAGRTVSQEHGITMVRADDPAMGRYLAKVGLEVVMGAAKTGRHDSWTMWEIAATAMDPEQDDEVRARCRAVWAEYTTVAGGRRMFAMSHGLAKRAGVDDIDETAEAERQVGVFTAYTAADAPVYTAADRAGIVPELKGLLASRAAPEVLAIVLSRRLRRSVRVEWPEPGDEVGLPVLRWVDGERDGARLVGGPAAGCCGPPDTGGPGPGSVSESSQ